MTPSNPSKSTVSLSEATVVSMICFGLFTLWSTQAVLAGFPQARFSDDSNLAAVCTEAVLAAAALLYLRGRNFDIHSLYPQPSLGGA